IISDYGAVRFIGIEQKFGGRYLPETKTYAAQTIAHNTIVANEASHFSGKESIAENYHSEKIFSSIDTTVQVVMAKEANAYKGIGMQRTVYLLQLPDSKKIMVDIFSADSDSLQQYDLPFHYNGNLIWTNSKYKAFTATQETLGKANGYHHLWKEAEAMLQDTLFQLTFLNDRTYYSISSLVQGDATVYFTRSGANDPDFNLRREPGIVIRKKEKNALYVNVLEIHGSFDPISEFSTDTYSSVKNIELLRQDADYTIASITIGHKKMVVAQCNNNSTAQQVHKAAGLEWTGPVAVYYDGKKIK
ncbi:MAG: heparinase, partial [Sphingobacteriales bacterium]